MGLVLFFAIATVVIVLFFFAAGKQGREHEARMDARRYLDTWRADEQE